MTTEPDRRCPKCSTALTPDYTGAVCPFCGYATEDRTTELDHKCPKCSEVLTPDDVGAICESCGYSTKPDRSGGELVPCNVEACPSYGDETDTSYCKRFGFTDLLSCKLYKAWNAHTTPPTEAVEGLIKAARYYRDNGGRFVAILDAIKAYEQALDDCEANKTPTHVPKCR